MREPTRLPKWLVFLLALTLAALPAGPAWAQKAKQGNTAVKPVPRDPKWVKRHEAFVAMAKRGGIDVLFQGDSITDAWGGEGHNPKAAGTAIFEKEFVPLKAANFGIGGDRTQHVLWRIQNGELEPINPKVAVVMIGTNNLGSNTNEQIAEVIQGDGHLAMVLFRVQSP